MLENKIEIIKDKTTLLYVLTVLIVVGIVSVCLLLNRKMYQDEKSRVQHEAGLAADAFEQHTAQIVNQVDVLLRGVRMTYLRTGSNVQTEQFINGLNFDTSVIENIFLADAGGAFIIPRGVSALSRNVVDRDYLIYHQANPGDGLFISAVEKGRISGKYRFRITRRITLADGSFGGVVIATVNPRSFTSYYRELKIGTQNVVTLIGIRDKKLRARVPEPPPEIWAQPIETPLVEALKRSESGGFDYQSVIDNVQRVFRYKKVGDLPLVLVVGFSETDVRNRIGGQKKWLISVGILSIFSALIIAAVLRRIIKTNEILQSEIEMRKRFENEIQRQLEEKGILLRETHHRIKNNIASISSLLIMHRDSASSPEAVLALQDAIGRVSSMSVLYEKMIIGDIYQEIPVNAYLNELVSLVVKLFSGRTKIVVEKNLEDFTLNSKLLFSIGIIVNELLTNVMKYAFTDRETGMIRISISKIGNRVFLSIQDNGKGLPEGFDVESSEGFGLMLVKILCEQINTRFSIETLDGTRSVLEFDA